MWTRGFPQRLVGWLAPTAYIVYMKFTFFTSKVTYHGGKKVWDMIERGETALVAVWHQDVMLYPFAFRNRNIVTMASLSRDGEIISHVFRKVGFVPIRGSSSRRGAAGMRELMNYVKNRTGSLCAMAADGPRGPARKAKKGLIVLAKHAGAPVFPVRAGARRRLLNRSWDQTIIPLPFNEIVFFFGEPIVVDKNAGRTEVESARQELENKLNELTNMVEGYLNRSRKTG